jgi:hypothetical protein
VELAESDLQPEPRRLAVLDRMDDDLEQLGLTLEEGRELLAAAQSALVSSQAEQWLATEDYCRRCCTPLYHKDSRWVVFRTVFGKVRLQSPRFWSCTCNRSRGTRRHTFSPLSERLPRRITPELEYLQVRWAAHMPYAGATALLKEVLHCRSVYRPRAQRPEFAWPGRNSTLRSSARSPKCLKRTLFPTPPSRLQVTAVSVDSAWLKHCAPPKQKFMGRQVNIVAGRATRGLDLRVLDPNPRGALWLYLPRCVRCPGHFFIYVILGDDGVSRIDGM